MLSAACAGKNQISALSLIVQAYVEGDVTCINMQRQILVSFGTVTSDKAVMAREVIVRYTGEPLLYCFVQFDVNQFINT